MKAHVHPLLLVSAGALALPASLSAQIIYQDIKVIAADGALGDQFGHAVAVSGTIAVIGAEFDDDNAPSSGSAYLFDTTTGAQLAKLLHTGSWSGRFGSSVAIDGDTVLIGAPYQSAQNYSGAVYIFDAATGTQIDRITRLDPTSSDNLGYSVAVSGTTGLVGAVGHYQGGPRAGAAFLLDTTTGSLTHTFVASDAAAEDQFGYSVAIDGDLAVVGAPYHDHNGTNSGGAYLFNVSTQTLIAELLPTDGAANDFFGTGVAIRGGIAVVGASQNDDNGLNSGSAYLFDTTTGAQIAKLLPNDGATDDRFGYDVAIDGDLVVVGAHFNDDLGADSGSAYLFDATTGAQIAKILPTDGAAGDFFARGAAVAISGTTAVVGAYGDDDNGSGSGAAYFIQTILPTCPADVTTQGAPEGDPNYGVPDWRVTGTDLNFFVNHWVVEDPLADITTQGAPEGDPNYGVPDGFVTASDLNLFVNLWNDGCY